MTFILLLWHNMRLFLPFCCGQIAHFQIKKISANSSLSSSTVLLYWCYLFVHIPPVHFLQFYNCMADASHVKQTKKKNHHGRPYPCNISLRLMCAICRAGKTNLMCTFWIPSPWNICHVLVKFTVILPFFSFYGTLFSLTTSLWGWTELRTDAGFVLISVACCWHVQM